MPNKVEAVESFIKGKKYQKLRDKHTSQLLEEYKEHIVPSIKKATKYVFHMLEAFLRQCARFSIVVPVISCMV